MKTFTSQSTEGIYFGEENKPVFTCENVSDLKALSYFFKSISKFVQVPKNYTYKEPFKQFYVKGTNELLGNFEIELPSGISLERDFAFGTTLIKRNGICIPLVRFFRQEKVSFSSMKQAKRRKVKVIQPRKKGDLYKMNKCARNAYKFIANEIDKSAKGEEK